VSGAGGGGDIQTAAQRMRAGPRSNPLRGTPGDCIGPMDDAL